MSSKSFLTSVFAFFLLPGLLSCAQVPLEESKTVRIAIEEGESFVASPSYMDIPKGEDALFRIALDEGYEIESVSYPSYSLASINGYSLLTLEDVSYSTIVTLTLSQREIEYSSVPVSSSESVESIESMESSESVESSQIERGQYINLDTNSPQIRINAPSLNERFEKEGYLQTGWSVNEDGSGDHIGFGWRIDKTIDRLYPVFEEETDISLFEFVEKEDGYHIKGYTGDEAKVVLPSTLQGKPVVAIDTGAFSSESIKTLILSPSIKYVGKGAISCPNLSHLTLFDSTTQIKDNSLDCPCLKTLRVNAAIKPRFSGTYWDTFQNKVDYLRQVESQKKLILFSGSSTRYGFNSISIEEAFPDYKVVNMGVYAYSSAFPQLEMIMTYLNEGDALLHCPELDAIAEQFCHVRGFDMRTWNFLESGYQELERLDIGKFCDVFDSFSTYQSTREKMEEKDYSIWAYLYDDDGNKYNFPIYNEHGDMTFYRANTEGCSGPISQQIIDYRVESLFGSYPEIVKSMDGLYQGYIASKGIRIFFGHAPKNRYCLDQSGTEEDRRKLDEYFDSNLSIPIIMDVEDSLYDAKYFYLIDNHLSSDGVIIHTEKMISYLRDAGL